MFIIFEMSAIRKGKTDRISTINENLRKLMMKLTGKFSNEEDKNKEKFDMNEPCFKRKEQCYQITILVVVIIALIIIIPLAIVTEQSCSYKKMFLGGKSKCNCGCSYCCNHLK